MQPYLGEIRAFAGTFAPEGWLLCDGSLQLTSNYPDLFVVIGNTYGGDAKTTFGLPDLRGRLIVQNGQLAGGAYYSLGDAGGSDSITLTTATMTKHNHALIAGTVPGVTNLIKDNYLAAPNDPGNPQAGILAYLPNREDGTEVETIMLKTDTLTSEGGSQAHENRQPFLCITYIIAVKGIFPSSL